MAVVNWRRPVLAKASETYGYDYAGIERRDIRWYIPDKPGGPDERRLLQGMVCANCCEVFPAPPSVMTLRLFEAEYIKDSVPGDMADRMRASIMQGRCPMCDHEVSPEMASTVHEGLDPFRFKETT